MGPKGVQMILTNGTYLHNNSLIIDNLFHIWATPKSKGTSLNRAFQTHSFAKYTDKCIQHFKKIEKKATSAMVTKRREQSSGNDSTNNANNTTNTTNSNTKSSCGTSEVISHESKELELYKQNSIGIGSGGISSSGSGSSSSKYTEVSTLSLNMFITILVTITIIMKLPQFLLLILLIVIVILLFASLYMC